LDDCLSLLSMISILSPSEDFSIERLDKIKRLTKEFNTYLVTTNSLTKVFLSIKGIYYQAVISGVKITWICPYEFIQNVLLKF
jgi:pescadillo